MKKKGKIVWIVAALAVLAGGVWYFQNSKKVEIPLETARVERGTLEMMAAASGSVEADISVDVKSRASGEVVEISVQAGDVVKEGDLLVRLDPADEERKLEAAEAAYTTARARLAQSLSSLASSRSSLAEERGRYERRRAAFEAGLVSGEELATAKTSVEVSTEAVAQREADVSSARASLDQAQLTIDEAKKRIEETVIKSPVSGTVLSVAVERGSIVSSGITNVGGGTALLTVADLSSLYVMVKLDEASIGTVRPGQAVRIRVDAFPQRVFEGAVDRVTPLGVNVSNIVTFDVRVKITDPGVRLLLPGMGTDVEIVTALHEDVLLIPNAALRRGSDTRAVARDATSAAGDRSASAAPADSSAVASSMDRWAGRHGQGDSAMEQTGARRDRGDRATDATGDRPRGEHWRGRRSSGETGAMEAGPSERFGRRSSDTASIEDRPGMASRPSDEPGSAPTESRRPRSSFVKLASGEERRIMIGATDGIRTVVLEGLVEGDSVVVGGDAAGRESSQPSNPFMPRRGGTRNSSGARH